MMLTALAAHEPAFGSGFHTRPGVYPGDPREDFAPVPRRRDGLPEPRPPPARLSLQQLRLQPHGPTGHRRHRRDGAAAMGRGGVGAARPDQHGHPRPARARWPTARSAALAPAERRGRSTSASGSIDGNWVTGVRAEGAERWVQFDLHGGAEPLAIDQVDVVARVRGARRGARRTGRARCSGSDDGAGVDHARPDVGHGDRRRRHQPGVKFAEPSRHRYYRVVFDDPRATTWHVGEVAFRHAGNAGARGRPPPVLERVDERGPRRSSGSTWISARRARSTASPCTGSRGRPRRTLQVSDDAATWRTCSRCLPADAGDDLKLTTPARGRYVRVLMKKPASRRAATC